MSGARRYTFAELADWAKVIRCRGIIPGTGIPCDEDHELGAVTGNIVHWGERTRITKQGVRRFLYLCAQTNPVVGNSEGWARIYLTNEWIRAAANALGIRLPTNLANHDRARVRSMIAGLPVDTPLRPEAISWSRRERQARTTPPA
jgi:hypothetical protein